MDHSPWELYLYKPTHVVGLIDQVAQAFCRGFPTPGLAVAHCPSPPLTVLRASLQLFLQITFETLYPRSIVAYDRLFGMQFPPAESADAGGRVWSLHINFWLNEGWPEPRPTEKPAAGPPQAEQLGTGQREHLFKRLEWCCSLHKRQLGSMIQLNSRKKSELELEQAEFHLWKECRLRPPAEA